MRSITFLLCLLLVSQAVTADVIAVVGTGRVGGALGTEFAAQGHSVVGLREP